MESEYWTKNMEHDPTRVYYETLIKLCDHVKMMNGLRTVFEVGTGWGISGSVFLKCGAEKIVSVDCNLDAEYGRKTKAELISKKSEGQELILLNERIENVAPGIIKSGEKFDLVYVDGDHGYQGCLRDLWYAHELVKDTGFIILDDFLHVKNLDGDYGIIRAVREYLIKTQKTGAIFPTFVNAFLMITPGIPCQVEK